MATRPPGSVYPVILSGGSGTRLWPLSRRAYPKQLLPLTGTQTLIQETALRVHEAGVFAPISSTAAQHLLAWEPLCSPTTWWGLVIRSRWAGPMDIHKR